MTHVSVSVPPSSSNEVCDLVHFRYCIVGDKGESPLYHGIAHAADYERFEQVAAAFAADYEQFERLAARLYPNEADVLKLPGSGIWSSADSFTFFSRKCFDKLSDKFFGSHGS